MKKLFLSSITLVSLLFAQSSFAKDPIGTFTEAFRATDQTCCSNKGMAAFFDYVYMKNAEKTVTARVRCEGGFWSGGANTLSVHVSPGPDFKFADSQEYKKEFDSAEECSKVFESLTAISTEAPFVMDWEE